MAIPVIGQVVDDFEAAMTSDKTFRLSDYQGKYVILYFYPKDSTPGCTTEGQEFRDAYAEFQALDAEIVGVSRDGLRAHENFKAKQSFPFELISDKEEAVCQLFDVMKMKNMYGRQFMGVERSTFIIGKDGQLIHEWRKVKVKGHVAEVLATIKAL